MAKDTKVRTEEEIRYATNKGGKKQPFSGSRVRRPVYGQTWLLTYQNGQGPLNRDEGREHLTDYITRHVQVLIRIA